MVLDRITILTSNIVTLQIRLVIVDECKIIVCIEVVRDKSRGSTMARFSTWMASFDLRPVHARLIASRAIWWHVSLQIF